MEKKLYVIPSLEVIEMECVCVLADSINHGTAEEEENDRIDTKKLDGSFNHTWE